MIPGFERKLIDAPADILGQEVTLLHWSGVTERTTLTTREDAASYIVNGWTRYKPHASTPS